MDVHLAAERLNVKGFAYGGVAFCEAASALHAVNVLTTTGQDWKKMTTHQEKDRLIPFSIY
jgi:hypothetical protein